MSNPKGILFKGEMVRAILEGRKTQTRRECKSPGQKASWNVGDILYVKETWGVGTRPDPYQGAVSGIEYRADEAYLDQYANLRIFPFDDFDCEKYEGRGWRPSRFMPKAIARIWLKVTNVRVERLLDISEADAIAEGIEFGDLQIYGMVGSMGTRYRDYRLQGAVCVNTVILSDARESYFSLWDSINGAGSHKENPWVFVIEFERIEKHS